MFDADGIDDSEGGYTIKSRSPSAATASRSISAAPRGRRATTINAGWLDTKTAVGVAFKFLFDPRSPFTSAAYRDIDIVLPEATSPTRYRRTGRSSSTGRARRRSRAILRALGQALGERAVGGDFGSLDLTTRTARPTTARRGSGRPVRRRARARGARTREGDADSYRSSTWPTTSHRRPRRSRPTRRSCLRKEYVPDTSGAGYNRGGAAVLKDTMFWRGPAATTRCRCTTRSRAAPASTAARRADGGAWADRARGRSTWPQAEGAAADGLLADAIPVAGTLDPETKRRRPRASTSTSPAGRCGTRRPTRSSAT